MSKLVKHQFSTVVELNAEPIPSGFTGRKLFGEPFMIHPGSSVDSMRRSVECDFAGRFKPRERNIIRGAAWSFSLLTHAVFTVNHERLYGVQGEVKTEIVGYDLERLVFAF